MIEWPQELVTDLARRRAVIVIGSGVSRHSIGTGGVRPPTWKNFLLSAVSDCPNKDDLEPVQSALDAGDYLHACEWLKQRYDEGWIAYLRKTFSQPAFQSARIHQEILNLDSRVVLSLNFDDIYERHAASIHFGSHIVKNYYDPDVAEFLRGNRRYIIKVHGNLNAATQMIFTQQQYSEARVKNSAFYQAFDAALLTHTFLFIGCGISDPDVNLLLENQNFGFPSSNPHYFLTTAKFGVDHKRSLRNNRNIKAIEYEPVDDFHTGLVDEISELNKLVETERFELVQSTDW
jgi:hypothetical protein